MNVGANGLEDEEMVWCVLFTAVMVQKKRVGVERM